MNKEILNHFRIKLLQNPKRIRDENGNIKEIYDQPERSKREDVFVIKGSTECIAMDAIPSKECKEYHQNSYLQINGTLKRCGTLNTKET